MTLTGDVRLDNVSVSSPANPLAIDDCNGDITVAGSAVERMDVKFSLNDAPYRLTGAMRHLMPAVAEMIMRFDKENPPADLGAFLESVGNYPDIDITLAGRSFDVRPFEEAARAPEEGGISGRVTSAGPESKQPAPNPFAGNPGAIVALKNTTFTVRLDSIIAEKALVTEIDARGAVKDGVATVDSVTMRYAGGTGKAALDADFRDSQHVETKVRLLFAGIDAGTALSGISDIGNLIEGRFSFETDGSFFISPDTDPLSTLAASGRATSEKGRINMPQIANPLTQAIGLDLSRLERFAFSRWVGGFIIENGRMFTDDWIIASNSGDWAIRGSFGFDGTLDYVATLVVPPVVQADWKDLSKYGDLADLFKDGQGNLVFNFAIGGVAKSPTVKLDRTGMERKAGEKLIDELKKKAKGLFDR
jgi:hypothetical protein